MFNPDRFDMQKCLKMAVSAAVLASTMATSALSEESRKPAGWQTWTFDGSCYALVYADQSPTGASTERAYIAIKHVPKEKTFDGVSIVSGIDVPVGAEAIIDVGGQEYPLLVFRGAGFVRSGDPERTLVEALGKASEAKVTWMLKDQLTVQTYRLDGFANAKKTIDVSCGRPSGKSEAAKPEEEAPPAKPVKSSRRNRG